MDELNDFPEKVVMIDAPRAHLSSPDVVKDTENPLNISQWGNVGSSAYKAVGRTIDILHGGVYEISANMQGESIFFKKDIKLDEVLEFPDSQADKILGEINNFWTRKDVFKNYGFLHRRGYILYGPPGSGKTVLVQQVMQRIVDSNGIVFVCGHPGCLSKGLATFREIEPHRPIVCVFEDLDSIVNRYGDEEILSLLDGEDQINQVLNIATTNYPERLEKRLVGRPRRFDRVIKIGMPDNEVRTAFFKNKLKIDEKEIKLWVDATENFSFAAMSELVITVKCLGNDFDESVKTLRSMLEKTISSEDDGKKMGFGFTN